MYAASVGRRAVDLYNGHRRDGPPLSPRAFFDDVVFPLFFDDERFLMWVSNSAFDQRYKQRARRPLTAEVRREALATLHADAAALTAPHGHLYLGGAAREVEAATSGQVSDVAVAVTADEVYCSWVGAALSVGVGGGLSVLVGEDAVLLALLDGWGAYRRYLTETPPLLGHQVETWNGWWLAHRFGDGFDPARPLRGFDPRLKRQGASYRLETQDWVRVVFALARRLPERALTAYVFSFGQTNRTVGFLQLRLPEVHHLADLYVRLFGEADGVPNPAALARLYQAEYGFAAACRQGAIGLRALQPAGLRDHMPTRRGAGGLPAEPKRDGQRVAYHVYLTWITAMLDDNDLIKTAEHAADALRRHAASDTKGRTAAARRAEQALGATSRRGFIDALADVVAHDGEGAAAFDALVDAVVRMPASDFPLLLTLIRFKYAVRTA